MSLADIERKTTLSMAMEALRKEGYNTEFEITDGKMADSNSDKSYKPDDVTIKHHYRFEGESDPSDMSILYAVETDDGHKGIVVNAYGAYASKRVDEFMMKCHEETPEANGKAPQ